MERRHALTIPLEGVPLHEQEGWVRDLEAMGYTDLFTSEAQDVDGFTPLVLASQWAPSLRLGCACFPVQTRGAATLAMSIAALCDAAPGRFVMGIGSSSEYVVSWQNGVPFEKPYQRTRDTARFLRAALAGKRVTEDYETFSVRGFRLTRPPDPAPPVLVAALREGMLKLAGREGDGAILNYVTPEDAARVAQIVHAQGEGKEIAARIYVCPTRDAEKVRAIARRSIAPYFSVPTYRKQQEWLGKTSQLAAMWKAWEEGDVKGARAAIPDAFVDSVYIHGPPEYCRERIAAYHEAGVHTPILGIVEEVMDPREASRLLAPAEGSG